MVASVIRRAIKLSNQANKKGWRWALRETEAPGQLIVQDMTEDHADETHMLTQARA